MLDAFVGVTMDDELSLQDMSLTEQIVLLAITEAEVHGETPVASVDVRARCLELVSRAETEQVSTPDEPDVMRALSVLGTKPYVEESQVSSSPTGKGRPKYTLDSDPKRVLDGLEGEQRLSAAVDAVRDSSKAL